jgi:hypothetical protein
MWWCVDVLIHWEAKDPLEYCPSRKENNTDQEVFLIKSALRELRCELISCECLLYACYP